MGMERLVDTPKRETPCAPHLWETHGVIHGQKLQIQERWCVGCKSPSLKNDWQMPMFLCVCISVSDQSPSTKVCNKQDCRNQVVQFLTNPFLANFQKCQSFPLYFVGFAPGDPKGDPCAPLYRGAHGFIGGQSCKSKRSGGVCCMSQKLKMTG